MTRPYRIAWTILLLGLAAVLSMGGGSLCFALALAAPIIWATWASE